MTYSEKLKDPRWQRRRLEILERTDFTCVNCNSKDKTLHVHHTEYRPKTDPWDYPNECLLSLCEDCHKEREEFQAEAKEAFNDLLRYRSNNSILRVSKLLLTLGSVIQLSTETYRSNLQALVVLEILRVIADADSGLYGDAIVNIRKILAAYE